MTPPLYTEDIYDLYEELISSYPLLACNLKEEDEDRIFCILENFLDKFSLGYRNYN